MTNEAKRYLTYLNGAFPLIFSGWLAITLSGDFLTFSLESFQNITVTFIVHAVTLFSLKRIS